MVLDPRKINFLISTFGTFGSLYFSEIMKFPPCNLCWYQRILFYPLTLIYFVALWTDDKNYRKYVTPFIIGGLVIAIYHNLLYYGFIEKPLVPCTEGASCTEKQLELFGFLTIPLLSLFGFLSVGISEIVSKFYMLRSK